MITADIACTSDDRYAAHTAAMLHSLRWHAPDLGLRVHFLRGAELSARSCGRLERFARDLRLELHWVDVPGALVQGLPARDYLSRVVWYRVFMPQLLSALPRVLYLDSDVLAMDSIAGLWATEIGDAYFAAVTNVVPEYFSQRAATLGLPGAKDYFNLGVALWNLERLRAEGFTAAVLDYARASLPELLWLEQDAINALYWQRRKPLHPRWNCQNGIFYGSWGTRLLQATEMREALESPGLVHFEGGTWGKPWHLLSDHPLRQKYWFHRRQTPWPAGLPEGITLRNLVKKFAPEPVLRLLRQALRTNHS